MDTGLLKPVVALAAWSMLVWAWLFIVRIPALRKAGIDMTRYTGGTGKDLDRVLPEKPQWIAHNYNHLMEQPTLFYAVALALALLGQGTGPNVTLAWGYVVLRVAHSIVQATWNKVTIRFLLFMLASLCLVALTVQAVIAVFN